MKWTHLIAGGAFALFLVSLIVTGFGTSGAGPSVPNVPNVPSVPDSPGRFFEVDLNAAVEIGLPKIDTDLQPAAFTTPDGREGWVLRIPGGRPIATPAYADGLLFVGGGYGSHEFYAFNAQTGEKVWQMKTGDDGPSAAVVEDGYVAFNTESCTVIVAEAKTGRIVWQEWLGDPLMSQPAIADGNLYIAYPESKGDRKHRLLCADLKTGKHRWKQEISGDVISAPVVDGKRIYFTCFDGTAFCLDAGDGAVVWSRKGAGTSAPLLVRGTVMLTMKESRGSVDYEGIMRLDGSYGERKDAFLLAAGKAEHLKPGKGGGILISGHLAAGLDSSVGFAAAPPDAKLNEANDALGIETVAGAWSYQGARVAYNDGLMMNAQGRTLNGVGDDGKMRWKAVARGEGVNDNMQVFSPPSLGRKNMYVCSSLGHLISLRQQDGEVEFMYTTKQPIVFQPALAEGNLYAGTVNGMLICLKTGGSDADGWYAWGGNARHNK